MSAYTYWPYDEVSLDTKHDTKLTLKTPWLEATVSNEIFDFHNLTSLSTKLEEKSLSGNDIGLVNDFFKHFHQYPVAYILPTPKEDSSLDKHELRDQSLLTDNLEEVLGIIFQSKSDLEFGDSDLSRLLSLLPRKNWDWDTQAALNFATIHEAIHPECLFSISRRYHILETMNSDRGDAILKDIEKRDPKEFKIAACCLVRQNHYVTEKCQEALKPAISIAGQASLLIEHFMEEERGHDKILGKALQHLGEAPENIEVSVQTKALMHLLKYVAQRNFLAFSMAIDAFERNNFEEMDPMANLLSKGGYDKAAEFINLHKKINDHGEHDNIAIKFLAFMDLCPRDYAFEALRLMELLSMVMSSISKI